MRIRSFLSPLAALAVVLGTSIFFPAFAQLGGAGSFPGAGRIATGQRSGSGQKDTPAVPEPDSVPGAKPRGPVAPATKAVGDMQPNDALFDAINRGDIAAARDALNRGADLNAVNVLGMTPMELSVDLGRNDISFLLLSMRGEDSSRGSRAVASQDNALTAPVKGAPSAKTAKATRTVRTAARVTRPAGGVATPISPPKLFADDGGTPVPSAGFLGFASR